MIPKTPTRTLSKPLVIKGVTDKASLEKASVKLAGRALGNLVRASDMLDTRASVEILDRAVGKVSQGLEVTGEFTIRALHFEAERMLKGEVLAVEPEKADT